MGPGTLWRSGTSLSALAPASHSLESARVERGRSSRSVESSFLSPAAHAHACFVLRSVRIPTRSVHSATGWRRPVRHARVLAIVGDGGDLSFSPADRKGVAICVLLGWIVVGRILFHAVLVGRERAWHTCEKHLAVGP